MVAMAPKHFKGSDAAYLVTLTFLAAFIWLRDQAWVSTSDDTLPILVAIPVFVWFGWPWHFQKELRPLPSWGLLGAATGFFIGVLFHLVFPMAVGWCLFLWAWIQTRIVPTQQGMAKRLMILPLIAFPWVSLDMTSLGWWFRISGAAATESVMAMGGYEVLREGTFLHINGHPISVEPACSGLNTLQSMLIAGSVMAYTVLGESPRYWWNLPLLVVMAWVANTARILLLTFVTIHVSAEFAMGPFHDWGGWAILVLMFTLCWGLFTLQEPTKSSKVGSSP